MLASDQRSANAQNQKLKIIRNITSKLGRLPLRFSQKKISNTVSVIWRKAPQYFLIELGLVGFFGFCRICFIGINKLKKAKPLIINDLASVLIFNF
jgi:hypothetical protein